MKQLERWVRPLQALFAVEAVFFGLSSCLTDYDGFTIAAASLVAKGHTPFIDFPFCQGPLLPYIYAPLTWVFGTALLPARVLGLVFLFMVYALSLRLTTSWFSKAYGTRDHDALLTILLTLLWALYPELLGALPRLGSKESIACFFLLMAYAGLTQFKNRGWGLAVSAACVAVSIGMKYPIAIMVLPLLLYALLSFGPRDTLIYAGMIAGLTFLVFSPYVLTGNFDYVLHNFKAPQTLVNKIIERDHKAANKLVYLLLAAGPALLSLARAAMKYQLVLVPAIPLFARDLRVEGPRALWAREHNYLLVIFFFMAASSSMITPAMHRLYMYVPLLLIFGTISLARIILAVERQGLGPLSLAQAHPRMLVSALLLILGVNSVFLFQFQYNDGGHAFPNFAMLRWWSGNVDVVRELNKLCPEGAKEEVLYVGEFQDRILASNCALSPRSVMSYVYLPLDSHYDRGTAERYKFMTQDWTRDQLRRRTHRVVVFDNAQLKGGTDYYGVDYTALNQALNENYELRYRAKWLSIFAARTSSGPSTPPASPTTTR